MVHATGTGGPARQRRSSSKSLSWTVTGAMATVTVHDVWGGPGLPGLRPL